MSRIRIAVIPGPGRPVELSEVCGTDVALCPHRTRLMAGGCSLPTALHAVERGEAAIGDTVLVLGSGPVGLSAVAVQYTDHGEASFNPHADLNRRHLDVRGSWGSEFSHFHRAVALMADPERSRPWGRIPTERYGRARANQALDDVASKKVVKALIDPRAEP
ncbi:MAG: hypothetical protein HYS34_01490 [Acidobacteria bacterium]|nr:hypothetical protein [Acidobacteriota bacterium]